MLPNPDRLQQARSVNCANSTVFHPMLHNDYAIRCLKSKFVAFCTSTLVGCDCYS